MFNYERFESLLYDNCLALLSEIKTQASGKSVSAFALYSDEDACTLCCAYNTIEHLDENKRCDPDDFLEYKWCTAEWFSEGEYSEFIEPAVSFLIANRDMPGFESMKVFSSVVNVLIKIKPIVEERFGEGCLMLFNLTDCNSYGLLPVWCKALNSIHESEEYVSWLDDQ